LKKWRNFYFTELNFKDITKSSILCIIKNAQQRKAVFLQCSTDSQKRSMGLSVSTAAERQKKWEINRLKTEYRRCQRDWGNFIKEVDAAAMDENTPLHNYDKSTALSVPRHSEYPNSLVDNANEPQRTQRNSVLGDKNRQQKGYCSKVEELWVPKET